MNNSISQILDEIKKVVVGKEEVTKKVLMAILAGGHVLLEDVPGVGKTTLALSFSKTLGMDYKRIQFTSDTMPSDVTGFTVYNKETGKFVYQQGPVITNILLADEINRTSSKTQAALLEVMEEKQVTVDLQTMKLPEPFFVIATQNPVGSAGTMMLPASQMDRFMIKLSMGYPDFESHVNLLMERATKNPIDSVNSVLNAERVKGLQETVKNVNIDKSIYEYITRLVEKTRNHELIELGVSPRGALSLCHFSKAKAFVEGRNYVVPEDVRDVFEDVCLHRLVMSRKARISGNDGSSVIAEILDTVEMPKIVER